MILGIPRGRGGATIFQLVGATQECVKELGTFEESEKAVATRA